jgi:hypothetical protein
LPEGAVTLLDPGTQNGSFPGVQHERREQFGVGIRRDLTGSLRLTDAGGHSLAPVREYGGQLGCDDRTMIRKLGRHITNQTAAREADFCNFGGHLVEVGPQPLAWRHAFVGQDPQPLPRDLRPVIFQGRGTESFLALEVVVERAFGTPAASVMSCTLQPLKPDLLKVWTPASSSLPRTSWDDGLAMLANMTGRLKTSRGPAGGNR